MYLRLATFVNVRAGAALCFAWVAAVCLSWYPVANAAGADPWRTIPPPRSWAAVSFSVRIAAPPGTTLADALERDFAVIKDLSLDTVLIRHAVPADVPVILAAAQRHGLKLIMPDSRAIAYMRTGVKPRDLIASLASLSAKPSVAACHLGFVVDDVTRDRAMTLAKMTRSRWETINLCVTVRADALAGLDTSLFAHVIVAATDDDVPPDVNSPRAANIAMTIDCRSNPGSSGSDVYRWLRDFHMGLTHGWTGGIVLEPYRTLPGPIEGICSRNQPPTPDRKAMIKRICERSREWTELIGPIAPRIIDLPEADESLSGVLLSDSRQACLLIVNRSIEQVVRSEFEIPNRFEGRAFQRAVEVGASPSDLPGKVVGSRNQVLKFNVTLGPGEASLFELH